MLRAKAGRAVEVKLAEVELVVGEDSSSGGLNGVDYILSHGWVKVGNGDKIGELLSKLW